jgi:hypothetical protein
VEINRKNIIFLAIGCSLLAFILFSNLVAVSNNCLDTYDVGLYFQALVNMASGELNPYLTVRTLNIFNDHFEPILFLAVPSVWLSGGSVMGPIIWEWVIFTFFIFTLIRLNNYKNSLEILFLCLLARGILTALVFPIHPNTWSMIAWLALVYSIREKKFFSILLSAAFLMLFRESNAFALPGLALYYFVFKEFKKAWLSFIVSLIGIFIIFKLRPMILGPTYDYGGYFVKGLLDSPFLFVFEKIIHFDLKAFLKVFFPVLIPLFFILRNEEEKFRESPFLKLLFVMSPLAFLHFLAGKIHYHYGITFIAPLISYIVLSPKFSLLVQNKKWFGFTLVFFLITASSSYTKWFNLSIRGVSKKCTISSKKRRATASLDSFIEKEIPLDKTIFSSSRVVPNLMKEKRLYYVPSHFTTHLNSYDYLLMEKSFGGEFRSLTKDRYLKMLDLCRSDSSEVLLDNKYYFLMKGPILKECYGYFSFM